MLIIVKIKSFCIIFIKKLGKVKNMNKIINTKS